MFEICLIELKIPFKSTVKSNLKVNSHSEALKVCLRTLLRVDSQTTLRNSSLMLNPLNQQSNQLNRYLDKQTTEIYGKFEFCWIELKIAFKSNLKVSSRSNALMLCLQTTLRADYQTQPNTVLFFLKSGVSMPVRYSGSAPRPSVVPYCVALV